MRKLFTLTAFLFAVTAAFSQDTDCKRFRNGTFRIIDKSAGNTTLIRKGSKQTEIVEMTGKKYVFKVKWVDDCTYTIAPLKSAPKGKQLDDVVVTVKITETKENSYIIEATSAAFPKVYRNEVLKIK